MNPRRLHSATTSSRLTSGAVSVVWSGGGVTIAVDLVGASAQYRRGTWGGSSPPLEAAEPSALAGLRLYGRRFPGLVGELDLEGELVVDLLDAIERVAPHLHLELVGARAAVDLELPCASPKRRVGKLVAVRRSLGALVEVPSARQPELLGKLDAHVANRGEGGICPDLHERVLGLGLAKLHLRRRLSRPSAALDRRRNLIRDLSPVVADEARHEHRQSARAEVPADRHEVTLLEVELEPGDRDVGESIERVAGARAEDEAASELKR